MYFSFSAEEQFLYQLKSEIICESQTITYPMSSLVCDCVGDGGILNIFHLYFERLIVIFECFEKDLSVMWRHQLRKKCLWDIHLFVKVTR